jgi:plasmid stability protein
MHRTQILLDEEQYEGLKEEAARSSKSLGATIRELLESALTQRQKAAAERSTKRGLRELGGFFSKPGVAARDHDKDLYDEVR